MDSEEPKTKRSVPAARATLLAHAMGFVSILLMLVWLLRYRGGINLLSDNGLVVFNVHPFLMFFGFIFVGCEAMMAFKTVRAERPVQKLTHMSLHLIAIVLGIVGLHAVFKFHNKLSIPNMYSLHSWIGIATFSLYCLQWLLGLTLFLFPGAPVETRAMAAPWHVCAGRVILIMSITTALTGLIEKATFLKLQHQTEGRLVNLIAVAILFFGISVELSISLARQV